MQLNKGTKIIDTKKFIKGHVGTIKNYGIDSKVSKPYLDRLEMFCKLKGIKIKSLLNKK